MEATYGIIYVKLQTLKTLFIWLHECLGERMINWDGCLPESVVSSELLNLGARNQSLVLQKSSSSG